MPTGHQLRGNLGSFDHYIPLEHKRPDLPKWFDSAIQQALAIDPKKRYTQLSEFVYDLNHPNPRFLNTSFQPLLERNPLLTWRLLSLGLLITNCVLLYYLFK